MSTSVTDCIEKKVLLKAPRARVWRAIADPKEFGTWFGVAFDGVFKPGQPHRGKITTKGYDHLTMEIYVERIVPERLFAFRWHPYDVDPSADLSREPTTLVTFTLEEVPEGTRLTIVESGFDAIPLSRRAEAFRMNEGGWSEQIRNIERHVARH
jgi:uncharacterized protein YndB with AHSA1/START domain